MPDFFSGQGVFSLCSFKQGDFLLEYAGERISAEEANIRSNRGNNFLFGFKYKDRYQW